MKGSTEQQRRHRAGIKGQIAAIADCPEGTRGATGRKERVTDSRGCVGWTMVRQDHDTRDWGKSGDC